MLAHAPLILGLVNFVAREILEVYNRVVVVAAAAKSTNFPGQVKRALTIPSFFNHQIVAARPKFGDLQAKRAIKKLKVRLLM